MPLWDDQNVKVAVVHEWLENYAGSERVVEQMLKVWPDADLYAVCDFVPPDERAFLGDREVHTTFIQNLPMASKHFRMYLGMMPIAIEQFDMSGYDLVLSSSHAVAKGVLTGPGQRHVSYIHSPMRYAWDLQHQYLEQSGLDHGLKSIYARRLMHKLRAWDQLSSARPDVLVANSTYISERIRKCWRRESSVIHPPVDTERFTMETTKEDYFFVASRMVPYKRIELIAEAFSGLPQHRLIICGDGSGLGLVQQAAAGSPNIELRGPVPQPELISLMQRARACVYAAEEDFGIATVEAQACGTPVIAYGKGGAVDIVRPGVTGVLFPHQTAESLRAAVAEFDASEFSPQACRTNSDRFTEAAFRSAIEQVALG